MTDTPEDALRLLAMRGRHRYGEEGGVTVFQHSLQCALLAERESAGNTSLVTAALLHDIGHVLHDEERAARRGVDMRHEELGEALLGRWFGPEVTMPVRLHVPAKRYLCAIESGYFSTLSDGSVQTLKVQGGPFSRTEAECFISQPFAREAVKLRQWDDRAKVAGLAMPGIEHFAGYIRRAMADVVASSF